MPTIRTFRRSALALVLTATATLAACSSGGSSGGSLPGSGRPTFTLGDKNFPEEYLLGDLYQQALQAQGYTVDLKSNLGSSEIADAALQGGKIDGLPEYTGVIFTELAHKGDLPQSAAVTLRGATAWENSRGVSVLNPTPFQDKDGVAVLKSFATAHHLSSIGDLATLGSFTFGAPPENRTRYQGLLGLQKAYGLTKTVFKPLTIGAQYTPLDDGKIDTANVGTTDGQLKSGKYVVLADTKNIFGFQQVVPIVKTSKLKQMGPAFAKTLNKVDALLTTTTIIALNKLVQIDKQDPAKVAAAFLKDNGLAG